MKRSPSRFVSVYYLGILCILEIVYSCKIGAQTTSLAIAVEDDAAPWSQADGTGYANDVVVAAFKAAQVNVDLRVVPYARCKWMAINGEVVACFSTSPSTEFQGLLQLSAEPLFTVRSGYFYNITRPPRVTQQENLPPRTVVGTVLGYEYPAAFETLKKAGVIVTDESPSEDLNLKKLAAGRLDLALVNYNVMKSPKLLIERAGVYGKVKRTFLAGSMNSYIAFSTKHPQGDWSLKKFNKGFARIKANGTLARIRRNWSKYFVDRY